MSELESLITELTGKNLTVFFVPENLGKIRNVTVQIKATYQNVLFPKDYLIGDCYKREDETLVSALRKAMERADTVIKYFIEDKEKELAQMVKVFKDE